MSHWKKRYFVLESFTLFYFENESAFLSGKQALGMVPMGSCQLKRINDSYKGRPFAFELGAEHLGLRNFVLCASKVEDMVRYGSLSLSLTHFLFLSHVPFLSHSLSFCLCLSLSLSNCPSTSFPSSLLSLSFLTPSLPLSLTPLPQAG